MKLNLSILMEDLKRFHPQAGILGDPLVQTLEFYTFYAGEKQLEENRLYIARPEDMTGKIIINGTASLVFLGEPAELFRKEPFHSIWISEKEESSRLVSLIAERFWFYQKWEKELQEKTESRRPLRELAQASLPVFRRPISLYSSNFLVLFYEYHLQYGAPPVLYRNFTAGEYVPEQIVKMWDYNHKLASAINKKDPYIFSAPGCPDSLSFNLYIMNEFCATIELDRIGEDFTRRDFALIKIFGMLLKKALLRYENEKVLISTPLLSLTTRLLEHQLLDYSSINAALEGRHWNIHDRYICMYYHSVRENLISNLLHVIGENLCGKISNSIFVVFRNRLLIIRNISEAGKDILEEDLKGLADRSEQDFKIAVSPVFDDYSKLYYFYQCTSAAMIIGLQKEPHRQIYKYQDYAIDHLLQKYLDKTVPEIFYPKEYLAVLDYDSAHGTQYEKLLKCLVMNNNNIAATAKKLFLHRNTVSMNIQRLQEHFHIDVRDPKTQLTYMVLFMMKDS